MITSPPEFRELGNWFSPEFQDFIPKEQDIFDYALSHLNEKEHQVLKRFLVHVLQTVHDPGELLAIWQTADARILFPNDTHLRAFLWEIVRRIG